MEKVQVFAIGPRYNSKRRETYLSSSPSALDIEFLENQSKDFRKHMVDCNLSLASKVLVSVLAVSGAFVEFVLSQAKLVVSPLATPLNSRLFLVALGVSEAVWVGFEGDSSLAIPQQHAKSIVPFDDSRRLFT